MVTANDTDVDLPFDQLTVSSVSSPTYGTASITSNGLSITYSPDANSFKTDLFSYIVKNKYGVKSLPGGITAIALIPSISISKGGITVANGSSESFSGSFGTNTTSTFLVRNNGVTNLTISAILLPNGYTSTLATPMTLSPGQSASLPINYDPQEGSGNNGQIVIYSNDPQNPSFTINSIGIPNGPVIGVSANGSLLSNEETIPIPGAPGAANVQDIVISNSGNQNLNVNSLSVVGVGYSIGSFSATSILPGNSITIPVTLQNDKPGPFAGSIKINSNDFSHPAFQVNLDGDVVGPQLTVTQNQIPISNGGTFNGVGPTSVPIDQTVTITNSGNQNMKVNSVAISGAGYSVISGSSSTVLAPGKSTNIVVQHSQSSTPGTFTGSLTINTNDTVTPSYSATLSTTVQSPSISITNNGVGVSNGGSLVFPQTTLNSPSSQTVVFTNGGTSPLTISNLNLPHGFYVSGGNASASATRTEDRVDHLTGYQLDFTQQWRHYFQYQ